MKRNIRFLALLLAVLSLFSITSDIFVIKADATTIGIIDANTTVTKEKIYSQATVEDDFSGKGVLVVLNSEATKEFKTYSIKDFSCDSIVEVKELTSEKAHAIQETLRENTADKLSTEKNNYTRDDIDTFRSILYLELEYDSKENVLNVIRELEENDDFLYVGPDYYMHLCATPDDSEYLEQWGLAQIQAPDAWDIENIANVTVGVVDSGIQGDHPDLANRVNNTMHRDFTTGAIDGTVVDIEDLEDPHGHGTHVAGIIGAETNNTTGCAGVCWDVELVSLRVATAWGSTQVSHIINAINYAENAGIDILNLSLQNVSSDTALVVAAANYSGLIVASAGNYNRNNDNIPNYPSYLNFLDNVISVGASDVNDNRSVWASGTSSQSNYGKNTVDVFAPGTAIYSTLNTGGYGNKNGTSMAAPFVAGVAALMMSVNGLLNPIDIKTLINASADKVEALEELCVSGGRLNAYEAVVRAMNAKAITITQNNRYHEEITTITEQGGYRDYVLHFDNTGRRVIQTFGTEDTVLELFASDGTLLLGNNQTGDKGFERNALLSYDFENGETYILRVKFFFTNITGKVRIGIIPSGFTSYTAAYGPYGEGVCADRARTQEVVFFRYRFSESGAVTFTMSSDEDTYLYVIDPESTDPAVRYNGDNLGADSLYDDDSAGNYQAEITKTVIANKEYLVLVSFYNLNYMEGEFEITATML